MNKRTTDSYFPFFGVPYHLILHKKNEKLGLGNLVGGGGGWGGLGLALGGVSVLAFFWFRRESENSVMEKLHWKKIVIAHSMAYLFSACTVTQ